MERPERGIVFFSSHVFAAGASLDARCIGLSEKLARKERLVHQSAGFTNATEIELLELELKQCYDSDEAIGFHQTFSSFMRRGAMELLLYLLASAFFTLGSACFMRSLWFWFWIDLTEGFESDKFVTEKRLASRITSYRRRAKLILPLAFAFFTAGIYCGVS